MAEGEMSLNELLQRQHAQVQRVQEQNTAAFTEMSTQVNRVVASMITQGALNAVSEFTGKEKISEWLQEIEKTMIIQNLSDSDACSLAWAKSKGTVARFIGRTIKTSPDVPWKHLRALLDKEYGNIVDKQQAFSTLRNIKQRREEDISSYVERLLHLANKAYGDDWKNETSDLLEDQLVGIFLDGLQSYDLKVKIYREEVRDIDEAIRIAKKENLSRKRFSAEGSSRYQRNEEPMEIGHHRPSGCSKCGNKFHRTHECRRDMNIRPTTRRVRTVQAPRFEAQPEDIREKDKRLGRCFRCHRTGHFSYNCPRTEQGNGQGMGYGRR